MTPQKKTDHELNIYLYIGICINSVTKLRARSTGLLYLKQLDHMYHMIGFDSALKFHLLIYIDYHAYSILHFITIVVEVIVVVDVIVTFTEDLPFFFKEEEFT